MVRVRVDGIDGLLKEIQQGKSLICFGAGGHFDTIMNSFEPYQLSKEVKYILDNHPDFYKGSRIFGDYKYTVISPDDLELQEDKRNIVLLITSHAYAMEIVEQLDKEDYFNGMHVYIASFLSDGTYKDNKKTLIINEGEYKIPKIIHYCWFGGEKIPETYLKCMDSWRQYCPDYEIKRWDESNFDVHENRYMYQAYEKKKWAFVSDYARLKIIYDQGGIYLDCDVELVKNLDPLRTNKMYCGFEDQNHVNLGLGFGAVKGHSYLKAMMEFYDSLDFIKADGSINLTPCPAYQSLVIRQFGIKNQNEYQKSSEITAYPTEFFSPVSAWGTGGASENTYSIHHYGASWQAKEEMEKINVMYKTYQKRIAQERAMMDD